MAENEKIEAKTSEEPKKADKKPAKKDKPSFIERVKKFWREYKSELKKVVWPSKSQMINNTLVVIACVVVVGVFIWVFDAVAGLVVNGIITLVRG